MHGANSQEEDWPRLEGTIPQPEASHAEGTNHFTWDRQAEGTNTIRWTDR
jgi:hypothetical protein